MENKGRYLTKDEVVENFKENILPKVLAEYGKDQDLIEGLWEFNLDELFRDGKIRRSSKFTWDFPQKELK